MGGVLITGATGFISVHLVEALLKDRSFRPVAVVRELTRPGISGFVTDGGVDIVQGNFYDPQVVEAIFRDYDIESVVHLAALRGAGSGSVGDYQTVNVDGTGVLLAASLRHSVARFIYCSSVGVYGTIPPELPAHLQSKFVGDNEYHRSKIRAEELVLEYQAQGLNACIVRPTITYGKGDTGFSNILTQLVKRRLFWLPADAPRIHLLHVGSLTGLFVEMLKSQRRLGTEYIVADREPVSLRELADAIYYHYHRARYPRFFILPNFVFRAVSQAFKLFKNEKWRVRMRLISESWYYDIDETTKSTGYKASDTIKTFVETMCRR